MEARSDGVSKPRSLALEKMETLVRQMQSSDSGVPVRCQKLFLTTIPSAFMGYDLIEWLMENLPIDDSVEALHLASLLCQHGYFFPVGDAKTLQVKDDSSLYRFQTPYYWPSRNHVPDSTDYAIYLHKKIAKNKQKHGLEDCELEGYNQLKKTLASKWDFVTMQADEQLKMAKDRKKGDKIVSESQERAYWRVYRPPPGFTNTLEMPPVPDRSKPPPGATGSAASLRRELSFLQLSLGRLRMKISQVAEGMITHHETYLELDPFLSPVQPSNPWLTDDPTFMELNEPIVEFPTERRVRRWAISMEETVSDPTGLHEFTACMRKEFSHENIRFWSAVHQLRKMPLSQVPDQVRSIYDEFLRPGAPCEINIDGKTMERTQELLKNPTRFTYDYAADHIFDLLLKKDCYPRFLRSEHYKNLLTNATNPTSKKRFFTFGAPGKKKISSVTPPNISQLVTSSGRLSSEDQSAVTTASGGGGAKPDCDPPYRKEEDAGIFLGGPATPPASARAPPAPSPSPSPCPARPSSDVSSALVPVSTSASAVVPYSPGPQRHGSALTSTSVSSPSSISTSSAHANVSSSAPTNASSTASAPTSVASTTVTTCSTASSASASAVLCSISQSSCLSTSSKDSNLGSSAAPSASGSTASGEKGNSGGPVADLSKGAGTAKESAASPGAGAAASASAGAAKAASAGPSPTSAAKSAPPAAGVTLTSAVVYSSSVTSTGTTIPPADTPPSVGVVSSEVPGVSGGSPAKSGEGIRTEASTTVEGGRTEAGKAVVQHVTEQQGSAENAASRDQVTALSSSPLCPPSPAAGDAAGDPSAAWTAAIAPPVMFQDMAAPLATIDERDEPTPTPPPPPAPAQLVSPPTAAKAGSPSPLLKKNSAAALVVETASAAAAMVGAATAAVGATAGATAGAVACSGSSPASAGSSAPHTEIVTLTDRCAQTVETGDSVDYASTTDKQCEANLPRERGTRRKEKRVKICEAPAASAASATASSSGTDAAATEEAAKRRSRSAPADTKRERKESRARREPRKKSSSERRRARLEDGEVEGGSPKQGTSPKRGDVVAPVAGEPAPQKLDESSVCPWENDKPEPAKRVVVRWLDVQTDI